ncbi:MAG: hypothetical protein ETSY1_34420 [Candidatus Entotheonella factor]|uniref:Periplasmic copper-binding protein NosD beta helix domain-containing protein n=1 Tax=Entotheonella factor TaxID=1429438 RepID=W4L9F4_ENTF1|nr:MAG: hypothetical protein ETSY1_34420 [Candidatus Entotheonella factor]
MRASEWIPHNLSFHVPWNTGVEVPMSASGYPLEIPYDPDGDGPIEPQVVKTIFYEGLNGHYPAGMYTLMFEGTGALRLRTGSAVHDFDQAGQYPVEVIPGDSGIILQISRSDRNDPIREIRFIMPGHAETYETQPFYPPFLERLSRFEVVRYMNAKRINYFTCDDPLVSPRSAACTASWANRVQPGTVSQVTQRGLAWEHLIDISNAADAEPWLTVPHPADDDYIRGLAELVKARLAPHHRVYLEYSNEVWNGQFNAFYYVQNVGLQQGLDTVAWSAGRAYTVKRSIEIFEIFMDVFGEEADRIVKIIPSQAATAWMSDWMMNNTLDPQLNPNALEIDAVAIAGYFSPSAAEFEAMQQQTEAYTVDDVLDMVQRNVDAEPALIATHKAVADEYGVQLFAYEGGQHIVGSGAATGNQALTDLFVAANRHLHMYGLYQQYLQNWYDAGGALFMPFDFTSTPGKFGSWGHLEWQDQPVDEAYKYRALIDFIDCDYPALLPVAFEPETPPSADTDGPTDEAPGHGDGNESESESESGDDPSSAAEPPTDVPAPAAIELQACAVLDQRGASYRLTQDVQAAGTCFVIAAHDVRLDGQGHTITGDGQGVGVGSQSEYEGIEIRNLVLRQFRWGIDASGLSESNISQNIIRTTAADESHGIILSMAHHNTIALNAIETFGDNAYGLYVETAQANRIEQNVITTAGQMKAHGLRLAIDAEANEIVQNTIETTGGNAAGIELAGVSHNTVIGNQIRTRNTYGIHLHGARHTVVEANEVEGGVELRGASANTLQHNRIVGNQDGATTLYLFAQSHHNTIARNTIRAIGDATSGIYLREADHNALVGNEIETTGDYTGYGIWFRSGVGNTATEDWIRTTGTSGSIDVLVGDSEVVLTDLDFDKAELGLDWAATGSARLRWVVEVSVADAVMGNVQGATVQVLDTAGQVLHESLTDREGRTTFVLTEFVKRFDETNYLTFAHMEAMGPYTVRATQGLTQQEVILDLAQTGSTELELWLE